MIFLLDPYEGASEVIHRLEMDNVKQFPSEWAWRNITEADFIGYSLRYCKILNKLTLVQIQEWIEQDIPYLKQNTFNRTMSLFDVIKDIYDNLEENKGYTKQELYSMIDSYGTYHKTYKYKVIHGNVVGVENYRYYIKNNNLFIQAGKYFYKNTGKPIKRNRKLF